MTRCRDCGSEDVAWGKTKDGRPLLKEAHVCPSCGFAETLELPHFVRCPEHKRDKKGKQKKESTGRKLDKDSPEEQAIAALMSLRWKDKEVRPVVMKAKAQDVEGIIAEALRALDEEKP